MIVASMPILNVGVLLVHVGRLVVILVNVMGLIVVLVCVAGPGIVLVFIPRLATVLVFVMRMVIIAMGIVVGMVAVVPVLFFFSGVLDVNGRSVIFDTLDDLSDRSLELRQRLLLSIVQRGSIRDAERVESSDNRRENQAEERNSVDDRDDGSQRPFLDRSDLVVQGQDRELGKTGSDFSSSSADGSLELSDGLFLKVGHRSGGVLDSKRREEIQERCEAITRQNRETTEHSKRVLDLTVLDRPRGKRGKGVAIRKVLNEGVSSTAKRVMELFEDRLLSFSERDAIRDGVHANTAEEVRNRVEEMRSIVQGLNLDDFVPSDICG